LANHFNKQEKEWRRFKPMQGMKGLANGLDLLGKMIMAIQCMGYKNRQLKILFGGGLANVDVAPSLER